MQKEESPAVQADRKLLQDAQSKGTGATIWAYVRLSGPGWLQSAITLGGGSLAGALFLGALGGFGMLWLQLMAIAMGVVMLSAISYVTLSTGERPFNAINKHINPALGWGWLIATSLANMIWCMPQFSLCYGALDKNLVPGGLNQYFPKPPEEAAAAAEGFVMPWPELTVSAVILLLVTGAVVLNARRGLAATIFDWLLKGLVGMVVICFFGVVVLLSLSGELNWGAIFAGFIPDFSQWNGPTGEVAKLMATLPESAQSFWDERIVKQQRATIIGAAATAVGINMTFLMPYTLLHRGWDKPFRGLARFDLSTGMAIPYIIVTSCVVIASAQAFHGKADADFLSTDPAVFQKSPTFGGTKDVLLARLNKKQFAGKKFDRATKNMPASEKEGLIAEMAALPEAEKKIAASMVQRNAAQLSGTLAPLFGDGQVGKDRANFVFGLGVFGMGFSTIIILMLINGFVFCEALGKPDAVGPYVAGCFVAGVVGMSWPLFWTGDSKIWLAIIASNFGMMLLPIAYVTFFMMMNSRSLMGSEKPTGLSMIIWNVLMGVSVIGAIIAAGGALGEKGGIKTLYAAVRDGRLWEEGALADGEILKGLFVSGMLIVFGLLIAVGFFFRSKKTESK